ncbi:HEAT repeat domain-containing protein [Leptolyngbya sp. CCNP1308]|uniref:HEAT repeat domain-containing protein n=1 Tax=Leptolyngbya sp. CCNP1308 TaxID=3110255 RepID=UPI002B213C08|nr:HEAT repeat domain-containing protein [Leptolyngbya sp. CCNP1308]
MSITPDQQAEIVRILCQLLLESENPRLRARAAKSLGRLGIPDAILTLCQAVSTDSDVQVRLNAMDALVSIAKSNLTTMADPPKNQPTFNIGSVGNINTGDVTIQGDQVGIQYNYATSPELQALIAELNGTLVDLQTQNPTVATESQALTIIDAEFTEIQQDRASRLAILRQQLLNPERHFQASKATLVEVLKHFLEESVWAKALITYIDTLSTTPEEGI